MNSRMEQRPLLRVNNLVRHYLTDKKNLFSKRQSVKAVDGVSFYIREGETLGLVGESGCGKTTIGKMVVGIESPTSGQVHYKDCAVSSLSKQELQPLKKEIQIIFQNPLSALDPRIRIGKQVIEPLLIHKIGSPEEQLEMAREMLDAVGMKSEMMLRYPHELSGGQAQRVVIARALMLKPKLLVCDEPVSALDVSVQAQVTELLATLQGRLGISYLFISHDLKVVKKLSHRMAVMYLGQIVEEGECNDLFQSPKHPYTKALISAIPSLDPGRKTEKIVLKGEPPSPLSPPPGCRFSTRCPSVMNRCYKETPHPRLLGNGRLVCCHLPSIQEI